MTKGTAEEYWAATAEGHFEAMTASYQPGERADGDPAPRQARRGLPPLTASQTIVDAIAACTPGVVVQSREIAAPAAQDQVAARQATAVTAE